MIVLTPWEESVFIKELKEEDRQQTRQEELAKRQRLEARLTREKARLTRENARRLEDERARVQHLLNGLLQQGLLTRQQVEQSLQQLGLPKKED